MSEIKIVNKIRFKLLSRQQIKKLSVLKITSHLTYTREGQRAREGLSDYRLGAVIPGVICQTCQKTMEYCGGHFGHIDLAIRVYHYLFITKIKEIQEKICKSCAKIMLKNEQNCEKCGAKFEEYIYDQKKNQFINKEGLVVSTEDIRELFTKIEDRHLLGLESDIRREWLILTRLIIPSNQVRRPIFLKGLERSEDDLTFKLVEIVRLNNKLKQAKLQKGQHIVIEELFSLFDYHIITYFNNEQTYFAASKHRGGRALKTLAQRLKGKEGRFRYDLLGKRANYSARAVIARSTSLEYDEIQVPYTVAEVLTKKGYAGPEELASLKQQIYSQFQKKETRFQVFRIQNLESGKKYQLTESNYQVVLEQEFTKGILFERSLKDGDYVLFNRQRTLHKLSMLAHKVKISRKEDEQNVFKFNPFVCAVYNADFDGDEMNIHVPQSIDAEVELVKLLGIGNSMYSPKDGSLIFGALQIIVLSIYLLTNKKENLFSELEKIHLLSSLRNPRDISEYKMDGKYNGKDIFSAILPKDFSLVSYGKGKEKIVIENGRLLEGPIRKAHIDRGGAILFKLIQDYPKEIWEDFLYNLSQLSSKVTKTIGVTLCIKDFDLGEDKKAEIQQEIEKLFRLIAKIKREAHKKQDVEKEILELLSENRNKIIELVKGNFEIDNSVNSLAQSGARGTFLNFNHITTFIGQQFLRGNRILKDRTKNYALHYKNNEELQSQGFIRSNYMAGLTRIEYFFHSQAGREGLIDTAIRTAKAGYLQRKLIHTLEEMNIDENQRVIDSQGNIIQLKFGMNGRDPVHKKLRRENQLKITEGEPIGVLAAQSIGEPGMQLMLQTTYAGGASQINIAGERGLPRLLQILETRKISPRDVVTQFNLVKGITAEEVYQLLAKLVKQTIQDYFDVQVLLAKQEIILTKKENMREYNISELVEREPLLNKNLISQSENTITLALQKVEMKDIIEELEKILKIKVLGQKEIYDAVFFKKDNTYSIFIRGMSRSLFDMKEIDEESIYINSVKEVFDYFGVEGAREYIYRELKAVMEDQGISVSSEYFSLLADVLTQTGEPTSILRSGAISNKEGVLSKAAFETRLKILTNASISEAEKQVANTTELLFLGQKFYAGTGKFKSKILLKK